MLRLCFLLGVGGLFGCSSTGAPEYPETRIQSAQIELMVTDSRPEKFRDLDNMGALERDQSLTRAVILPEETLVSKLQTRLSQLRGSGDVPVLVEIDVQRSDVTYFSHYTDEFVRFDVTLHFTVKGPNGALLGKGKGGAWRKIPREEATDSARLEAHMAAAVEAFDRYFAHEGHIEGMNVELKALNQAK